MPDQTERLRSATHLFLRSFGVLDAARTPCGQPLALSEAHALLHLLDCKAERAAPTVTELARVLCIDKSNATRLCQRMLRSGHLTLRPCPQDGRAKRISLTAKGTRLARSVSESSRKRFQTLLSGIPRKKRAQVLESLHLLNESLLGCTLPTP
ncbi:MAG TPA: MarR family transcriptional regulator [Planctomycetes bacterium]|nr:MarR family transcriptional regulator [Planctomycetota bacterium]